MARPTPWEHSGICAPGREAGKRFHILDRDLVRAAFDPLQVLLEGRNDAFRQAGYSIFGPFAIANDDLMLLAVHAFHPQTEGFQKTKFTPLEEWGDQPGCSAHRVEDSLDLLTGEHGGEAFGPFRAREIQGNLQRLVQDCPVQKEDDWKYLVSGGGRDIETHGVVGQENFHPLRTHVFGVAFVVKEDKVFNPGDVSLLHADGVAFTADDMTNLLKELGAAWGK